MCLSMENCVGIVIKVYIENRGELDVVCFSLSFRDDSAPCDKKGCVFSCWSVLEQSNQMTTRFQHVTAK